MKDALDTGELPTVSNLLTNSHDIRLSAWGPYTKRYIGISHIPAVAEGLRFDLSLFPGLYRRNVLIPNVRWDSGYHPWAALPDLSYFSHRHNIIGKDKLYCDIAYYRVDETAVITRCNFINNTDEVQNLALHAAAWLNFPPKQTNSNELLHMSRVDLPSGSVWVDALPYEELATVHVEPQANLTYDGHIRGEIRADEFVCGVGLEFGQANGDAVRYRFTVPHALPEAVLLLRYRLAQDRVLRLSLSGLVEATIELKGAGMLTTARLDLTDVLAGEVELTMRSGGGTAVALDGFALLPANQVDEICFTPIPWNPQPELLAGPRSGDTLILKYEHVANHYGLAWGGQPSVVRQFLSEDLDWVLRNNVHEHVTTTLTGSGEGHFTDVLMHPITLAAQSECVIYGLVCTGSQADVYQQLAAFDPASAEWEPLFVQAQQKASELLDAKSSGAAYRFSQERMAATVATNIVYPVRTHGTWIRHYTPGRWWDSLYTWDSGFIGLGLLELDTNRAIDNLNAYVTEPGEPDAAFIHHGSPVPTQFYLFHELWNRTQAPELLAYFYPRLQQYHRFMAGRLGSSTTRGLRSNLLKTWDYFYNSGGWDDYPPQVYVHQNRLEGRVTPVVTTAHVIRTAKLMRMASLALGLDTAEFDEDITLLGEALHRYAWDEDAGYFGYVCHDAQGYPAGLLRHESGQNFNQGLDGVSPLVAGICTPAQEQRLVGHLMSKGELWTDYGITAVSQSAAYYRPDGYWNGAVWMAHQWFMWRALLDLGRADEAHRIAHTALTVWQREVESSYNCAEHFLVQNGRGAGWHHFGGLSAPVLNWYSAYHRAGRLSVGLDAWVEAIDFADDQRSMTARLKFYGPPHHAPLVIVSVAASSGYAVTWNGAPVLFHERYPGTLEVQLPTNPASGKLRVSQAASPGTTDDRG
ncbi:MAG: hypothetical protein H6652_06145 [Ardenticatenaceae bacterium]|nr:hypothetical protein [Ardenticatenaceae bacterium]